MRGTSYRGLAVGVTSAALVLAGAVAAAATPGAPDSSETDRAGAVGAPWLPGTVARSIRQTQVPGERYEAAAAEMAATRRADALALAHGALRAARAVDAVADGMADTVADTAADAVADTGADTAADSVAAETVEALTQGVADLSALLDDARFVGVRVGAAPGAQRIPDADVAPTPVTPERDLVLAGAIQDAAGEVFRLSIQVEVAAREAEVDEPIGGPGDLRAPAALDPVEDTDEDAADGGGDATEAEGPPGASSGDGEPGAEGAQGAGGTESAQSAESTESTEGADATDDAADAADATGTARDEAVAGGSDDAPDRDAAPDGDAVPDGDAASDGGAPDGDTPEGDAPDGTETPGAEDAEGPDAAGAAGDGSSTEAATLDALPAELVEGLAELESAVAAASALLSSDILDLDEVPFLTPERARLLALAQGLDGDDVAAWSQWQNGRIPTDELCAVAFAPDWLLRCDAAYALELLNVEYRAEFGDDMGLVSAYRTYEQQVRLKASKGWLAATPGRSNHGWGLAVDLAGMGGLRDYSSPRYRWMVENGPAYGWHHPRSMQPGGSGPPEPWHFEFGLGPGSAGAAQQGPEVS